MKRNLRKYCPLLLFTLTCMPLPGIASDDCRLDSGKSKEGTNAPAELLPSCAEQDKVALDPPSSQSNEATPNRKATQTGSVPVQAEIHRSASVR